MTTPEGIREVRMRVSAGRAEAHLVLATRSGRDQPLIHTQANPPTVPRFAPVGDPPRRVPRWVCPHVVTGERD